MKLETFSTLPHEEQQAWSLFPKSIIQRVLHNEMVKKIEGMRDQLEDAAPEQVLGLQSSIQAHRTLLALLHRNDKLPTK